MPRYAFVLMVFLILLSSGCIQLNEEPEERKEIYGDPGYLAAYYRMDEDWDGSAHEVLDHSRNNAHGTTIGGTRSVDEGKFYRAAMFDGFDDVITVGDHPSLDIYGNGLTMSAWIKVDEGTSHNMVLDKEESYEFRIDNGLVLYGLRTQRKEWYWISSSSMVPLEEWCHVVITYDGLQIITYINGDVSDVFDYPNGPIVPSDKPFSIGAGYKYNNNIHEWDWGFHFNGCIDEVAIFSYTLDQHEVHDLYLGIMP